MSIYAEINGAAPLPTSLWEVDLNDASLQQTDSDVERQLEVSGIVLDRGLHGMLASMGVAFGDPNETMQKLADEIPDDLLDRIYDNSLTEDDKTQYPFLDV